ncbi:hypothetical protein HL667_33610 [Bradyrhizobium sp. 83012]|uniref:Uncharacterized protein n=1 Tax=Bradyrhizobium aeschynomenes TaxID=2734909 RepID=A0ABX2CRB4_9BRAD|nr:hypothetical protein [Bradyrhizobium aeschynomenes]NPU69969.1 hypothetical protein [Bradyrhizobium aeschynomenes]
MRRRRYRLCNTLPGRARPQPPRPEIPGFIDTALVPPRAGLVPSQLIARMADDMRQAAGHGGGITEEDLVRLGFTRAQVKLHADDARALAQQLAGASL